MKNVKRISVIVCLLILFINILLPSSTVASNSTASSMSYPPDRATILTTHS